MSDAGTANRPARVDQWGTFDVANFGDLLFPLLARHELGRRLGPLDLTLASPRGSGSGFHTAELGFVRRFLRFNESGFFVQSADRDVILLGGGDLLRFDDQSMARVYGVPPESADDERWFSSMLVDLGRMAWVKPVIWNCLGVPLDFEPATATLVRQATGALAYLSVRDDQSRAALERAGVEREIAVVPDTAFTLPRLFSQTQLDATVARLRADGQYPSTPRVLVVQVSSAFDLSTQQIVDALLTLSVEDPQLSFCLLPIGADTCELGRLKSIRDRLGPATHMLDRELTTEEIVAAISAADWFAGTSLHGNITAFTYGIPHLVLSVHPVPPRKLAAYCELARRPDVQVARLPGLAHQLRRLVAGALPVEHALVEQLTSRIDRHWDQVAERVIAARDRPLTEVQVEIVDRFHAELVQVASAEARRASARVELAERTVTAREAAIETLTLECEAARAALAELAETHESLLRRRSSADETVESLTAELVEQRAANETLLEQVELLRQQLLQAEQGRDEAGRTERTARATVAVLEGQLKAADAELTSVLKELARAEHTVDFMSHTRAWRLGERYVRLRERARRLLLRSNSAR